MCWGDAAGVRAVERGPGALDGAGELWAAGVGDGEWVAAEYGASTGADAGWICVAGDRGWTGAVRWERVSGVRPQFDAGAAGERCALPAGDAGRIAVGGDQRRTGALERRGCNGVWRARGTGGEWSSRSGGDSGRRSLGVDRQRIVAAKRGSVCCGGGGGWAPCRRDRRRHFRWTGRTVAGYHTRGGSLPGRALDAACVAGAVAQGRGRAGTNIAGWGVGDGQQEHVGGGARKQRSATAERRARDSGQPHSGVAGGPRREFVDRHQWWIGAGGCRQSANVASNRSAGHGECADADGGQRRRSMGGDGDGRAAHSARSTLPYHRGT